MKTSVLFALLILARANDELGQLILMSYNVMFVPSLLVLERDQMTRAHLLTRAKFLRSADILCLQEVFQPRPSELLLDSLATTYPYSTPILGKDNHQYGWNETWNRKIGRSSFKFLSGGLKILSKWPIVYAGQYFYRHSCSAHTFVRGGFIYAQILYGNQTSPVHVIGTHLQPSDHHGCYLSSEQQVREEQMRELVDFLDTRNISHDQLVFLLGDFNVDKHNAGQYEAMIDILRVQEPTAYPSSLPCSWDSSFNAMTHANHQENQLLDYIFLRRDHAFNDSLWFNLVVDRMASDQWHLLGRNRMFSNTRNIPLMELSDHYPVVGFFNLSRSSWPQRPSGVLTYVQMVTADTNLPVVLVDRSIRLGDSSNDTASLFLLTNNGTPRRHRCLKSDQYILLIDADRPEYYLSDRKYFRMKHGTEQAHRYLKIIQIDNATKCIQSDSTFILESRLRTGLFYVNSSLSHLCSCATDRDQAQPFRLIEVLRTNVSCTITH